MSTRSLLYIHALSPVHPGTGQALDVIDLPIARERSTDLPYLAGSTLKGVLRAEAASPRFEQHFPGNLAESLFGPPTTRASEHSGAAIFGDGRLLLFPVRCARELFCWVTSPYLLRRYVRDCVDAGLEAPFSIPPFKGKADELALVSDVAVEAPAGRIYLDDLDLDSQRNDDAAVKIAKVLAERVLPDDVEFMTRRFAIVSDSNLAHYARHATEVVARIALDHERGTVRGGGLWYEEALPAETILYAPVICEHSRRTSPKDGQEPPPKASEHRDALRHIVSAQIGGKASTGRGLCSLSWQDGAPS